MTPEIPEHTEDLNRVAARFERAVSPFQSFIRDSSTGSVVLFACVIAALAIANSPLAEPYERLLNVNAVIKVGDYGIQGSLHHWINDGLMVLFFFVLGLEIKREAIVGELKDLNRAIPVVCAAIGGMVVPASIYYAINVGTAAAHGWAIPTATDTAFAVGVLLLLGREYVQRFAVFLTALAIVDDIGAVAVIALFYVDDISVPHLAVAVCVFAGLVILNVIGVRRPSIYLFGALALWLAFLGAGVHATSAGILAAFATPARPRRQGRWLMERVTRLVRVFGLIDRNRSNDRPILADQKKHLVLERIHDAADASSTPLQRYERALAYPVALFVLPLFALMNAGVPLDFESIGRFAHEPVALGIFLGLLLGKVAGITGGAWFAIKCGLGRLPDGIAMRHVAGIGLLGGIGFTMSIFIAGLGLGASDDSINMAKTAILLGSLVAGVSGYIYLGVIGPGQYVKDKQALVTAPVGEPKAVPIRCTQTVDSSVHSIENH